MSNSQAHEQNLSLATTVDEIAQRAPNTPWVYVPRNNSNVQNGYKVVTFAELSQASNKLAYWIEQNIGVSKSRETIAFMDRTNDMRYMFAIIAAIKTGYKLLLTSTRNSVEGQKHLIQSTKCSTFLYGSESKADVEGLQDTATQFKALEIPTLEELMKGDSKSYPGLVRHDAMDTVIIIHTSGSTGLPKPIELRNGYIASISKISQIGGRRHMGNVFFSSEVSLCTVPFFHAMGLFSVVRSIYCQGPLVLPPTGRTINAEINLQMIKAGKPTIGFFAPSILEDLVDSPGGLEAISTCDFVIFGGAPLSQETGDKVSKVTQIQTVIGSTEMAMLDSYVNEDRADWKYFEWCPWTGAKMEPSGELCELVQQRLDNDVQGTFFSFPEIQEWRTKDLYAEHPDPTKRGLWEYRGRNDDLIVLSNGEKFNPITFEKLVEGHHDVKGALVVGQGRFQAGLILELNKELDPESFLEEVWPRVEKANELVAAHARVWKSKIAFAKSGKDFARAPKGNIIRRKTNELFENEINALYSNEGFADQLGHFDAQADEASVKALIKHAIHLTMPSIPKDVDENTDIFAYGVDSLQVLGLASALSHAMSKSDAGRDGIKSGTVYSNPTINSLTKIVHATMNGKNLGGPSVSREQKLADTLEKYTTNLPSPVKYNPRQQKHAVILTGSTGSLGGYLLEYLIASPNVAKVYCLNRSDAEDRQKKSFEARGVTPDFAKVTFLQTSFDKERFGLSMEVYRELEENVDVFIHNAWAVNFNMGLESFEDTHVAGTRRCVDFSASARYHPHIIFISSIASAGNWLGSGHTGPVPEMFMDDDSMPLPQGYGESKHVAGRILAVAAEKSAIPSTIVRVGQLAGPTGEKGLWNKQEWLPSIIASSKAMGKIPRTLGNEDIVDWVPTDAAAKVLLDLTQTCLGTQANKKLDVFHLVNPEHVSWSELVPAVQEFYASSGIKIEAVEFQDWLSTLKSQPMTQEKMVKIPGLKLIDFYEGLGAEQGGLPRMATEHTSQSSTTLKNLGPVNKGLITNWLEQWNF